MGDIISSSFDDGLDDWSVIKTEGSVLHQSIGGHPGGFLQVEDIGNDPVTLFAPDKFLGDLSRFDNGILSFDAKEFVFAGARLKPRYGEVTITGRSGSAVLDLIPETTQFDTWLTYSAVLESVTWGVDDAAWQTLLQDVVEISIYFESSFPQGEIVGLDNFELASPVPEPSTFAALAGLSAMGLVFLRRRRKKS